MKYAALLLVSFILACGSDSERVLHFTGRDETESNFRERFRELRVSNPLGVTTVCTAIREMTPAEAAVYLASDGPAQVPPGATPKPGQQARPADLERSAEIVQEECRR